MEDTTGGCCSTVEGPAAGDRRHAETCSSHRQRHWDDSPLVLTDGAPNRPRLRSVSAAAARHGVRAGMTLSEGRALCASLEVLTWDDVAIHTAITAATAAFVQVSPQVSPVPGAPGMWWIAASGFALGGPSAGGGGERAFAQALLALAQTWHPQARVAIADTCVAARAATWAGASFDRDAGRRKLITIVRPGGDAGYLASAPLTLLPMDREMRDALHALGIRTVGQFATLPAGDVEQRWGDEGLTAWRLSHGEDPRRPVLARIADQPYAEMELPAPAATMEPVLFLVRPAIENLVGQLVSQGRAMASMAITLTLDDARGALPNAPAHTITREIRLPRALARPVPLFERCRGLLARWPLTAPVTAVRVAVLLTAPLAGEQGNLLNTSWKDPGAADAALERVRAELGPDVVVRPESRDAYAPERTGAWHEDGDGASDVARSVSYGTHSSERTTPSTALVTNYAPTATATSMLRLLESPEKVEVDRDSAPRRIHWRGRTLAIASAVGPERMSGDWWNDGFSRDYWRCESAQESGDLMLYRDAAGWWLQGWYD